MAHPLVSSANIVAKVYLSLNQISLIALLFLVKIKGLFEEKQ
jgi:hypothetical protein